MRLIVGLGNPGPRYEATRHNAGFLVVERVARRLGIALDTGRWHGRSGLGRLGGCDVALLLPQTLMNASGSSVVAAFRELGLADPADLLVVLDDADLPLGRLRLRAGGGAGGHQGLSHVLACLGTRRVPRLRFGIGRPSAPMDTADFVLARFAPEEAALVERAVERAADAVEGVVTEGLVAAMNRTNPAEVPEAATDPEPRR